MKFIQHRVNKLSELVLLNPICGAEIDLRSDVSKPSHIHLSHDAWVRGDSFSDWLALYKEKKIQGTVIFNTKEDGLEEEVIRLAHEHGIDNFFFLDTAFPTLVKYVSKGSGQKFCCRLSIYETSESLEIFKGKVSWVWADCFEGKPLAEDIFRKVSQDFKICLVSPELQNRPLESIGDFKHLSSQLHSVCTKQPQLWTPSK